MKRILVSILAIAILLSMAACAATETTGPAASTEPAAEKYKIGVDVTSLTNETFVQFAQVFQDYCNQKGWELIMKASNEDAATQYENLESMITAGCDAIFSQNFDSTATENIYKEIKNNDIILVTYDSGSDIADYCFYCDNYTLGYAVGEMAGKWINENLNGEANVVCLHNQTLDFLVERGKGQQDGLLAVCPTAVIQDSQHVTPDTVDVVMENLLQAHPDLNVVLALADSEAYIAYQILNAEIDRNGYDPANYGIFANDGSDSVLPLIQDGTIYRGTVDLGLKYDVPTAIMEAIDYALTGEGTAYEHDNYYPCNEVTVENVSDYIS